MKTGATLVGNTYSFYNVWGWNWYNNVNTRNLHFSPVCALYELCNKGSYCHHDNQMLLGCNMILGSSTKEIHNMQS